MSPVQKYFSGDIHLNVCDFYERGGPQSANAFKLGANYAPTIDITEKMHKKGFSQALWLNNGNILESGATNIFFLIKKIVDGQTKYVLNTYPDDGAILPGITRDSILQIVPKYFPDIEIDISPLHIEKFCELHDSGELFASFVSGTASVIGKIASITYNEKQYSFSYPEESIIDKIKSILVDIQLGKLDSDFTEVIKLD
jgi:branched-chain amino acid aminotransferase